MRYSRVTERAKKKKKKKKKPLVIVVKTKLLAQDSEEIGAEHRGALVTVAS